MAASTMKKEMGVLEKQRTPQKTFSRQVSFSLTSRAPEHCILFLIALIVVTLFLQIQALKHPFPSYPSFASIWQRWNRAIGTGGIANCAHKLNYKSSSRGTNDSTNKLDIVISRLPELVTFVPLIDPSVEPMVGNTWFMSQLNDTYEREESEYLHFPSDTSKGKLLCLMGNDTRNGTRNSFALAWQDRLPPDATLAGGLTFVSESYYGYENIWHGLSAISPFVGWYKRKGSITPSRWVLYQKGELRTNMGMWVRTLTAAAFQQQVMIEGFEGIGRRPTCFQEAVVFRHYEGQMPLEKRGEVLDMLRCKARAYCNITSEAARGVSQRGTSPIVHMTLYLRIGSRSFKNDTEVVGIFRRVCEKVDGCMLTVSPTDSLTFCEQVKLMSSTDVLVSSHGAQLTNMFFMDRNSSVMEFFPYGWLEQAGVGQYVYHWIAEWSGMRHQGAWRDPNGEPCPHKEPAQCMRIYKAGKIGHDEAYFANWANNVLNEMKECKLREAASKSNRGETQPISGACQ